MKNPNDNRSDYEIAQEEASALYMKLGITCEISEPKACVKDDWACIQYVLTYQKNNGNPKDFEYSLGVGHVKWPTKFREAGEFTALFNTKRTERHLGIKDKILEARGAAFLAKEQKVKPVPSEVLATVCREALEAIETTFEDWTSNFGYDVDSRKAEKIHKTCMAQYATLLCLMDKKNIEKFAELAGRF